VCPGQGHTATTQHTAKGALCRVPAPPAHGKGQHTAKSPLCRVPPVRYTAKVTVKSRPRPFAVCPVFRRTVKGRHTAKYNFFFVLFLSKFLWCQDTVLCISCQDLVHFSLFLLYLVNLFDSMDLSAKINF